MRCDRRRYSVTVLFMYCMLSMFVVILEEAYLDVPP
jgi:hypothetical protein